MWSNHSLLLSDNIVFLFYVISFNLVYHKSFLKELALHCYSRLTLFIRVSMIKKLICGCPFLISEHQNLLTNPIFFFGEVHRDFESKNFKVQGQSHIWTIILPPLTTTELRILSQLHCQLLRITPTNFWLEISIHEWGKLWYLSNRIAPEDICAEKILRPIAFFYDI